MPLPTTRLQPDQEKARVLVPSLCQLRELMNGSGNESADQACSFRAEFPW